MLRDGPWIVRGQTFVPPASGPESCPQLWLNRDGRGRLYHVTFRGIGLAAVCRSRKLEASNRGARVQDHRQADRKEGAFGRTAERAKEVLGELLQRPLPPGLYLVATPIGNLGDISLRALTVLARADLIAAEDTRHSRKLTSHFGIGAELTPYHEHNAAKERPKLIARIKAGSSVALISDAGHAADLRSRLQARARGARRRPAGHEHPRSIGRARRADKRRTRYRHLSVCWIPAAEIGAAAEAARRACRRARDARAVRDGAAAAQEPRRHGGHAGVRARRCSRRS